jgi:uncharacterized membrane protein
VKSWRHHESRLAVPISRPEQKPDVCVHVVYGGAFFYFGDKRLSDGTMVLGYMIIIIAILMVIATLMFYCYLLLHAPNSTQAVEFERSSALEVADHLEKSKGHRICNE